MNVFDPLLNSLTDFDDLFCMYVLELEGLYSQWEEQPIRRRFDRVLGLLCLSQSIMKTKRKGRKR